MAQATNTQLGEIQLAGDLAGNGGAQVGTNPQLKTIPGLVPGAYVLPRITVDQKGRITSISNGAADIIGMIPSASATNSGLISLGDNIYSAGTGSPGYWSVNFGATLTEGAATGLANQACATYGFTASVDHGLPQVVKVAGSDAQTVSQLIGVINAQLTGAVAGIVLGDFVITSTTAGNNSSVVLSDVSLFACMPGFVNMGGETEGFGSCEIYVKRGSVSEYGVVKIGNGIEVENGVISVTTASIPVATPSSLGAVSVPTSGNLQITPEGAISVPLATPTVPGVIKLGTGLTAPAGVLTPSLVAATTSAPGVVQVGSNINVSAGTISIPTATASTLGVAKVGAGLSVSAGVVSLAIATGSTLGAVKGGGSGISIAGDGTISATAVPDATTSVKGIVQIGSGIAVSAGVISLADATVASKGVVQIGSGLSVASGVVSATLANGTTKGILTTADTSHLSVTNGLIDIVPGAIPLLNTANTFTKAQVTAMYDLGTGATITPNLSNSNSLKWAPTATSATINAPTSAVSGGIYSFVITTPANFTAIAFPSTFKFSNGIKPIPSASSTDILTCVYDGTNYLCTYIKGLV